MVFPGRFSTGCLRCRQRKVKCDETKPSCRRCAIYGKPCTGYTDQFHFRHTRTKSNGGNITIAVVTEEDVSTSTCKNKSSTKPSARERLVRNVKQSKGDESPLQGTRSHSTGMESSPLLRSIEQCYDGVSLSYFVTRFVSPCPEDGFPGHLSFLPNLYDSGSPDGLLETATLTVAQMAAYNRFGGEKFRIESYKNHGRAIKMMQDIIKIEENAIDDRVIASILLLCTLRDISGAGDDHPNEHASGLFYLIEKRGPEQVATSRGAELLFLALIRLQVHSFLHQDSTYSDPGKIASLWGSFDPLCRAMAMMSTTLGLRHSLIQHLDSQTDPKEKTLEIIQSCFEVLDDFASWDCEAATYWQTTFQERGIPTTLGQISSRGTHYDVETACTVILIRSARLILMMSLIAYYHQMLNMACHLTKPPLPDLEDQGHIMQILALLSQCEPLLSSDVTKTIDDMLACVPYALGEIDTLTGLPHTTGSCIKHDGAAAMVIVHSIRLVASCAYASEDQVQRAFQVLARFDRGIGIRAASCLGGSSPDDPRPVAVPLKTRWAREQAFLRDVVSNRQCSI
ncbi:hypothetical protein V8F06_013002 [Rhypophila decipiens]